MQQATGRLGKAIGRLALLAGLWWSAWSGADGLIVVYPPLPGPGPVPLPRPFVPPGHFRFAPLEVRFHRVEVKIDGRVATTAVDQEFFNPNSQRLEGTYIFPLPVGAHIDNFAMEVNGKMQEAELLDAEKARELYEQIVRQARDPALLEYVGRGAFKARIFPIEPRAGKRVQIRYTEVLASDAGLSEYVYPLNTEKFSARPLAEVSVRIELRTREAIQALYSPSHPIVVERQGDRQATILFAEKSVRPDSDFKLLFSSGTAAVGVEFLPYRRAGKDGFFMLLVSPSPGPGSEAGEGQGKDICFVLDTSGSMAGRKLAQAKRAMEFCLENLDGRDRFEVIRFSTEAELLFGGLRPADPEHRGRAADFVGGLKPIGGTAIHAALEQALKLGDGVADGLRRPYFVVFITDGLPTVGEIREQAIVDLAGRAGQRLRIFSLGVGVDVNTHLLDRIAEGSRGYSQYVLPEEDLEVKLSSFFLKISRPALTDLALEVAGAKVRISQLQPAVLPDFFHGDQLLVFGRYQGVGEAEVRLAGLAGGRRQVVGGTVVFPETATTHAFIPNLWATRRVGWLLDQIRRQGENQELKDEVTALAREYGIVTPYTAYLILEDEAQREVPIGRRNLRELESDRAAYGMVRQEFDSLRQEAASESSRSGRVAVDNAMSIQQLKAGSQAGEQRMARGLAKSAAVPASPGQHSGYRAAANYAQQVRRINGRTFYQNGTVWNDSTGQGRLELKERRIVFNSDDYFQLLRDHIEVAAWLALGTEVDVVVGDTLYQVREE